MNLSIQIPTVSMEEAFFQSYTFVDVRTPAEFAEFHIPNSINVPIFTNEERVEVGTIYKQVGKEKAKEIGIQLLANKLPSLYATMKEIYEEHGRPIVVYCWRGGMRSRSVVVTMGTLDIPVMQLVGGIRSYRETITETLAALAVNPKPLVVLEGNTGVGKTNMLQALAEAGYPVLDLEGFANHRGSAFGGIGLAQRSQKAFESLLFERIRELGDVPYYIIEAESRRIGNVILPTFILEGKEKGTRIHIDAPFLYRVQTICDMYRFTEHKEQFYTAFLRLAKRIPEDIREQIEEAFVREDDFSIAELLLKHYYDPRYEYTAQQYESNVYPFMISSLEEGIQAIKQCLDELQSSKQLLS